MAAPRGAGQGLVPAPPRLGAGGTYASMHTTFAQQYANSKQWLAAFKAAPKATCGGRTLRGGRICSAGMAGSGADIYAQLIIATSPDRHSSLNLTATGGLQLIGEARNQKPCATCAAFAVVAAAEAAVAAAAGRNVSEVGRLSTQQLYYCSGPGFRSCDVGWRLDEAIEQLKVQQGGLLLEKCLPYAPDVRSELPQSEMCARRCNTTSRLAAHGTFESIQISEMWQVQRHIRQHGAVISRFDIFTDFKPFFTNPANRDKVYSPNATATFEEPHAVALVGYDNQDGYWIARNSWGPSFGVDGAFKIAYGAANVLSEAYGLRWSPTLLLRGPALPLVPTGDNSSSCKNYVATPVDYLSRIAWLAGVDIERLLADNMDVIRDLDAPLAGKKLLVCGGAAAYATDADARSERAALLMIRAALEGTGSDGAGAAPSSPLASWRADGDPCSGGDSGFKGVACDGGGRVARVALSGLPLGGGLPPARALKALPRLAALQLDNLRLSGTLPPDWGGALGQILDLQITGNPGVTGQLPGSWGGLGQLRSLLLFDNGLTGTLPPEVASGWGSLEELHLGNNSITGPLPPAWGKMRALKSLRLYANKLTGTLPPGLGPAWASMEDLQLSTNFFGGRLPPEWAGMGRLQRLLLFENQLTGSLPPQYGLGWPSVAELSLSSNKLGGPLPAAWASMASLSRLALDDNKLTGTLPAALASGWGVMTSLLLSKNALGGQLPAAWARMGQLVELRLSSNQLNGTLPAEVGGGWLFLEVLHLHNNRISGTLPPAWGGLGRLRVLRAYGNQLEGPLLPDYARGWPRIEEVDLAQNKLGGTLPPEWGAWQFVQTIGLDSNRLTGTVPPAWGGLRTLRALYLSQNPGLAGCFPPRGLERLAGAAETVFGTSLSPAAC